MSTSSLLVFASLLISIAAQSCLTTSEIGPCQSGTCPVAGATCITSTGSCCAAGGVIGTTTTTTCVDLLNPSTGVSDCSSRAYLCNNSVYYSLMTTQCPRTCGRCSTTTTTTTTCVDLLNPSTGVSDCPSRAYLCNNSVYYSLMTTQCPRTCGRTCTTGKK